MRKLALLAIGAILASVAGLAGAAALTEGVQYTVFRPAQPTESPGKIEVTEYFWYGCSHCYHLEPSLEKWIKTLPKDVVFRRVPAVFPGRDGGPGAWAPGAKVYYTLDAMGLVDKFHSRIFDAVHQDRQLELISGDSSLFDWIAKQGIDAKKFAAIYNSFAVQSKLRRSMEQCTAYGFDGVPALIVDGRYMVVNSANNDDTLAVADQLIDMARKDLRTKK